jgi:hypothetical protein
MHDSYTRHECGIKSFTPTVWSRLCDFAILIACLAIAAGKVYFIFTWLF